jgi:hypothetical protein
LAIEIKRVDPPPPEHTLSITGLTPLQFAAVADALESVIRIDGGEPRHSSLHIGYVWRAMREYQLRR